MIASAFDLGEELKLKTIDYRLHQPMWKNYTSKKPDISFKNWKSVKYLNSTGKNLHKDVNLLPDKSGGLYLFYIKCPIIDGLTEFPFYIGRAQFTAAQNLRKRCKEYFQHYMAGTERPKLTRMIKYWGEDLYLAYIPLKTNSAIKRIEKQLINSLLLPMNDEIPSQIIRPAVKAFL
jgi:hypothetical protein